MNHINTRITQTDWSPLSYCSSLSEIRAENQLAEFDGKRKWLLREMEKSPGSDENSQTSPLPHGAAEKMTAGNKHRPPVPEIPVLNTTHKRHREIQVEHEWEGVVLSVGADEFQARLIELSDVNHMQEIAEFDLDMVSDSDMALLREGAIFRWIIGKSRNPDRTIELVSKMVFRRLPQWRRRDLMAVRKQAESDFEGIEFITNGPDET